MARIDAAYNYFLSTYGDSIGSRYQSHKKSELRETYNSILKTNKESPLYKITQTGDLGQFAIDIKEGANSVAMEVANISSDGDDISSVLNKKIAVSSDEEVVDATYVGIGDDPIDSFKITVHSLASGQTNQGNFLNPNKRDFEEGQYSFDLDTRTNSYEFQFSVNNNDTNLSIQQKISRLINTSGVGLKSDLVTNDDGEVALSVSSNTTGLPKDSTYLFNISSGTSFKEINTLGISNITSPAANSDFTLNGVDHSSMSNTFTVNKTFEITLKDSSEDEVTVGFMSDAEALSESIDSMLSSYNNLVSVGLRYSDAHGNNRLYNEVTAIGALSKDSLDTVGITADDAGYLSLDRDKLTEVINSSEKDSAFEVLNNFKNTISNEAKRISINPMNYVNKIVVEYKNPSNTLAYPYAASQYSGLLLDYGL